jgi:hypothetical protein
LTESPDKEIDPTSETGSGILVSLGITVAVGEGVVVGALVAVGVSVRVGRAVSVYVVVGSTFTCDTHADKVKTRNATIASIRSLK